MWSCIVRNVVKMRTKWRDLPVSVFVVRVPRACLQISDGACPAARAALEEFLAVRSTCLLEEKYAAVVELYVVKVLAKGFQETESAMDWVERANLTEERRLVSVSV